MSKVDLFLIIPIAFGAYKGFKKGFFLEVVSLVALVLGIIGGLKLLHLAVPIMKEYIGEAFGLLPIVTFLFVLITIIAGVHFAGKAVRTVLRLTPVGMVDNFAGALVGGMRWFFCMSIIAYFLSLAGINFFEGAEDASIVYSALMKASPMAMGGVGIIFPFVKNLLLSLKEIF